MAIHATAIVDPKAELDSTVEVGAYAIIEGDVRIGAGTRIYPHAYVGEGTTIGRGCHIHPFAAVGYVPQDLKYDGSPAPTEIGDETAVHEHASIHRGVPGGTLTAVGRRCLIMSSAHVGHNCILGDEVKVASGALLAGHITVDRGAFVSGNVVVHQFARIGSLAMVGGGLRVPCDIPPFMLVGPPGIVGINVIGLRRAGVSSEARLELRQCYHLLYRSGLFFREAVRQLAERVQTDPGRALVAFLQAPSKRGYQRLKRRAISATDEPVEST